LSEELGFRKPLIPTTYSTITERELKEAGFNVVIYANHLLRSAHKIMKETASNILRNQRGFEAESLCSPVRVIFKDVGFLEVKEKDMKYVKGKVKVIIPAAGKDPAFALPKSLIEISGKPILQRQIEALNACGIKDITVIKGYKKELFNNDGVKYVDNNEYDKTHILHSLFKAEEDMIEGFIYINSDIIFNQQIINRLIDSKRDIELVVDNSYAYHKHDIDKKLDLVLTKNKPSSERRVINMKENEVVRIGKNVDKEMADYEFIGIAYFSEHGVSIIRKLFYELKNNHKGLFQESHSFEQASFTDFIQEVIDSGFKVNILETREKKTITRVFTT